MKHILSADTARRLKAAGFPQPEPELYQIWYGLIGDTEKVNILIEYSRKRYKDIFGNSFRSQSFMTWGIYAPTATEILKELGMPTVGLFFHNNFEMYEVTTEETYSLDQNPAEAAAQMWLEVNKTK